MNALQAAQDLHEKNVIDFRREVKKTVLVITLVAIAVIHLAFNVMGMMSKVNVVQLGIINIGAVGFSAVLITTMIYLESRRIHCSEVMVGICTFVMVSLGYILANSYGIAGKLDVKTIGALSVGTHLVWLPLIALTHSAFQCRNLYSLRQKYNADFNNYQRLRVDHELNGPQAGRLNQMTQTLLAIEGIRGLNGDPAGVLANFRQNLLQFRRDFGNHGVTRLLEKYNQEKPPAYRLMTEALL
jgi:hypothetical protein